MTTPQHRSYDIVLFGATGFVGRLTAEHLAAHAPSALRVALAGRSSDRLTAVRDRLGPAAQQWPLVFVDAHDAPAVETMAAAATVVVSTVGPYAKYGMPLVAACARNGTHYTDLTGEVLFVRDSADGYHDVAAASGARIVHSCGFDSVPSDLSVLLAADAARRDGADGLARATLALRSASGGVSGGTVDSLRTQIDEIRRDRSRARIVMDPYGLSPARDREPDLGAQPDVSGPRWDDDLGAWTAPFVMGGYNTRIVRRSNTLSGWAYGRRLRYREVVRLGSGPFAAAKAAAMAGGLPAAVAAMTFGPSRAVLDRVLPSPGEGPGETTMRDGHFRFDLHATSTTGRRYRVRFGAQGDPGYVATSAMLGQSALALATQTVDLPDAAGVLTPATGIGHTLVECLRDVGFEIGVDVDRAST